MDCHLQRWICTFINQLLLLNSHIHQFSFRFVQNNGYCNIYSYFCIKLYYLLTCIYSCISMSSLRSSFSKIRLSLAVGVSSKGKFSASPANVISNIIQERDNFLQRERTSTNNKYCLPILTVKFMDSLSSNIEKTFSTGM